MGHRLRQKVQKVSLVSDVLYCCSQIEEHRSFDIDHLRVSFHDSTGGIAQRVRKREDLRKCLDDRSRRGIRQEPRGGLTTVPSVGLVRQLLATCQRTSSEVQLKEQSKHWSDGAILCHYASVGRMLEKQLGEGGSVGNSN